MLSDDITGGIGRVFNATGRVIGGAIRGALLFGAAALAVGVTIAAVHVALPAIGAASLWGAITSGAIFSKAALGAVFAAKGSIVLTGLAGAKLWALGGAALLGVTSIIPGISEGFGLKKLLARRQPERSPEPEMVRSRGREQEYDNPLYQQGRGAALMQKGDNAQGMEAGR